MRAMEAADVPHQLRAAREALEVFDYDTTYTVASSVHESGVAGGTDLGDAAFYAGEGAFGMGSMDAAHQYLTEASTSASGELRAKAAQRLRDLDEANTAEGATEGGMTAAEITASLAAGDDAIAAGDYDRAFGYFDQVYRAAGVGLDDTGRAGLGLAKVYAYQGDLTTGDQYAAIAQGFDATEAAAGELRTWIAHQQAANTDAADGITGEEMRRVWEASRDAYTSRQFDQAYALSRQIYDSPQTPAAVKASVAYNMGQALLRTQDYDSAHTWFQEAAALGDGDLQAKCTARFEELARRDEALALAAAEADDLAQPPLP